jgi:hypothetical protein
MIRSHTSTTSFISWRRCYDARILTMPHGRKALDARKGAAKRREAWMPNITYTHICSGSALLAPCHEIKSKASEWLR